MTDRKLGEYLDYVVQVAGTERRPSKEVRDLILVKAEELELPIRGEQILINGVGASLTVHLDYGVDIEFPGLQRVLYRKDFQHAVAYHAPR